MIVSHRYRYVFVELPRTGSTAIARELRENYDGEAILMKHRMYHEFLRMAGSNERSYFVFSAIRNPLDDAVSRYFKLKTDHSQRHSHPIRSRYVVGVRRAEQMLGKDMGMDLTTRPPARRRSVVDRLENRKFRFIRDRGADFSTFFLRYYRVPYDNWSRMGHQRFDFIIRFENLQEDFETALRLIGIEPKRPLPVLNQTKARKREFWAYYSPAAIRRAKCVFGPFMERWGYAMPREWGPVRVAWPNRLALEALAVPRIAYWRYLRGRI